MLDNSNYGRSWKVKEGHGRSWMAMQGSPYYIVMFDLVKVWQNTILLYFLNLLSRCMCYPLVWLRLS